MTAAQVLLVDRLMARPAVGCRHVHCDDKTMMVVPLLAFGRLVAFQAVHLLLSMPAKLVLMDNRVLQIGVAFGALARGAN